MNVDDVLRYGASLRKITIDDDIWKEPSPDDFIDANKIIILIHGFTSNGKVLEELGVSLKLWIKNSLVLTYNYNSFIGIDAVGEGLNNLLNSLNQMTAGLVENKSVYLVAHSMGGLVARYFTMHTETGKWVNGIVMLGTPNKGTLCDNMFNKSLIDYMIDYGEHITGSVFSRNPLGLSAKQLTKTDGSGRKPFIDQLNEDWKNFQACPPTLTISGGLPKLEVAAKNRLKNWSFNFYVQNLIFENRTNDGLVLDESVSLKEYTPTGSIHKYVHLNSYAEHPVINHTYLIRNATLRYEIIQWIK